MVDCLLTTELPFQHRPPYSFRGLSRDHVVVPREARQYKTTEDRLFILPFVSFRVRHVAVSPVSHVTTRLTWRSSNPIFLLLPNDRNFLLLPVSMISSLNAVRFQKPSPSRPLPSANFAPLSKILPVSSTIEMSCVEGRESIPLPSKTPHPNDQRSPIILPFASFALFAVAIRSPDSPKRP